MMILLYSFAIGIVAGLRAMMAPAVVSLAASYRMPDLANSWLAWLGYRFTPWILIAAAAAELVTDQLPSTPSRKVPVQFGTRIVTGGLAGAALAVPAGASIAGLVAGAVGAVAGTLGGAAARTAMAAMFRSDRLAAVLEDVVAIAAAIVIVMQA